MLKRVMAIVLLGFVGLIAGYALTIRFPSYELDATLILPAHGPHSAAALVSMTRDDHPGVRVDACPGHIDFSATGSSLGGSDRAAIRAESQAIREVIAANNGKVEGVLPSLAGRFYPLDYALDGLLAGVGIALGFCLPPRSRLTRRPLVRSRT
ncbi:MAG: hypothetical protein ACTHKL_29130 [Streptosporangiaceae bacterium]